MDADLVLWVRLYVPLIGGVALAVGLLVLRPPPTDAIESEIAIRYSFTLHRCHLPKSTDTFKFPVSNFGFLAHSARNFLREAIVEVLARRSDDT